MALGVGLTLTNLFLEGFTNAWQDRLNKRHRDAGRGGVPALQLMLDMNWLNFLALAVALGAELVGVNARNLKTLEVDRGTFERLAPRIPDGAVRIAESGVRGPHDVIEYGRAGAHVVLVGETLVRDDDPRATVADLVAAGSHPALQHRT